MPTRAKPKRIILELTKAEADRLQLIMSGACDDHTSDPLTHPATKAMVLRLSEKLDEACERGPQ